MSITTVPSPWIDNLGLLPEIGLRLTPDAPALLQGDDVITFRQLDAAANRVAHALLRRGIRPADRIALLFPNHHRYLATLLGVMRIGAVAVPLNIRLGHDGVRYCVEDSGARGLLAADALAADADRLAVDTPVEWVAATGATGPKAVAWEEWLVGAAAERPPVVGRGGDLCMQPYTSGSTGRPKGVLLTHAGQIHNADAIRRCYLLTPDERALVAVPMYHANAMSGAVLPFLIGGASVAILPGFDPIEVIRAVERYRATFMTGVPAMYKLVLQQREELARRDTSSLRFLSVGSAPVGPELYAQIRAAFDATVIEGYGLTEGGPVVAIGARWGVRKLGSTGQPLPGVKVRIVDDTGEDVPPGAIGELWVHSPGRAAGYHKLPAVTAQRFTPDGWLKTGDLMRADDEGFLYFLGRRDDMLNCGGENVYPKEVENLLLRHSDVADVAVVPVAHPLRGQVPVAYVVPATGAAPTEADLKAFTLAHGPAYAHPRRVLFLEALPLASTGKVDRDALIRRAAEEARPDVTP